MTTTTFDVANFPVGRYDEVLKHGLCRGKGVPQPGEMCIEAAICYVLDMPHADDPGCVAGAVRSFKISLNDKKWSSNKARAKGLRDLGLAQLGSLGTVDDVEFCKRLARKTISVMLPRLFRQVWPGKWEEEVSECERSGTGESARKLAADAAADAAAYAAATADANADAAATADANAAAYAYAAANSTATAAATANADANAAAYAYATATATAAANAAANAAAYAYAAANAAAYAYADAYAAAYADAYLILGAQLATEVLKEMGAPGVALIQAVA